ncbi:hypothetical protein [Hyphomonas sp.]|jgi:hypothetical protein|uniref:hypothetical protein n=1 Tax=Hyphomonas sp. TaxID=87 RepID=UPI0025BDC297|nr:hypothetical protein [Hyphomonas sp.]
MKFDFDIRPSAEIPAREALRPIEGNEIGAQVRLSAPHALPVSELGLLVRRQARLTRRATR